jgi:prepilin-type N-terminal cleavage/methylation domain-containing protein
MNRRGFTLIELMITLVLLSLVGVALYQAIIGVQRVSKAQVERMDVQQTTRAATYYLSNALRELDAAEGDILVADSTRIRFRAMRWTGVLCSPVALAAGNVVFVTRDAILGLRGPDAAQDSILLFRDGDIGTRGDDRWLEGGLVGVTPATPCPDGGPGIALAVQIAASSGGNDSALVGVTSGSPIRGYQVEDLGLWNDGTTNWVGRRTMNRGGGWTAVQPLVGPMMARGLVFSYFDSLGVPAATRTDVATVGLRVLGRSQGRARITGGTVDFLRDSIITRVGLRNNPRF